MAQIDQKLLYDLAPYSNAYGHTMSNYIYHYRLCTAYDEVFHSEETAILAEYYERILRSFLITKNIGGSKKLVRADMKEKRGRDPEEVKLPDAPWESEERQKVREIEEAGHSYLKGVVEGLRGDKKMKSDLEINAECFQSYYPDSTLTAALMKCLGKGQQCADLLLTEGSIFCMVLFAETTRFNDLFKIRFWRKNAEYEFYSTNSWFDMDIYDAVNMFPEIHKATWLKHK